MSGRFETFTLLINRISRSIRRIKTEEMSAYNLKSPHVSCLYYLYCNKTLTAKELIELCDEDKSAISRSLEYLEKKSYIKYVHKDNQRYKSQIVLTEEGNKIGKYIVEKINNILSEVGEGLTEEERSICYRSLDVICSDLQQICDKYEERT